MITYNDYGFMSDNEKVERVYEYGGAIEGKRYYAVVVVLKDGTRKGFPTTTNEVEKVRKEASDYTDSIK